MKKFDNSTQSSREAAVKIGKTVPADAIELAFYSTDKVTPENNLTLLDLSDTIPENRIKNRPTKDPAKKENRPEIVMADEFGILRTADGRYSFPTDDLSISNLRLGSPVSTSSVDLSSLESTDFVHSCYISRYFTSAPNNFIFIAKTDFVAKDNLKDLKIKVIDSSGMEYIDPNTGREKYRILLEPFRTTTNARRSEVPHRIIVLLDADAPINLQLVYDKVEADSLGNSQNQVLRYSETINAVPYFKEVPEEAFVIDPNYDNNPQFSIKKIDQKYSDIVTRNAAQPGYQVITPKKAIKDNRTYEAFNWRLIGRTRRNINLDIANYGTEADASGNIVQKSIKAAVLCSSSGNQITNEVVNPYVLFRLQSSPFNLARYQFDNPKGNVALAKNQAEYWKVNIDSYDDLTEFDILVWSPTSRITANQAQKINAFLRNCGTLILDLSSSNVDATALNPQLAVAGTAVTARYVDSIESAKVIDPLKNGGWNIVDSTFEKITYSILGSNFFERTSSYKSFFPFSNYAASNSFVNIGSSETPTSSIGITLEYDGIGDTISRGNIVAVTFPLLAYCNNLYTLATGEESSLPNYEATAIQDGSSNTYSAVVEGPFKLLFNAVAYAMYCRSHSSRFVDIRSSLYNLVGPWQSSWVMDSDAFFDEDEKKDFSAIYVNQSTQVRARDLTLGSLSAFDFYKTQLSSILPPAQRDSLSSIRSDEVEFFIESTNADVLFANSERVSSSDFSAEANIPSSYHLHKLNTVTDKLYAYTLRPSAKLVIPPQLGPYVVSSAMASVSEDGTLDNQLSVLNSFKSYIFDLDCKYTYARAKEKALDFDVDVTTTFKAIYQGTLTSSAVIEVPPPTPDLPTTTPAQYKWFDVETNVTELESWIDDRRPNKPSNRTQNPVNTFIYSGDIDLGNSTKLWKNGHSGDYVRYIQYTLNVHYGSKLKVDGVYGNATANAVKSFQTFNDQWYKDGTVDSETKSYFARRWIDLRASDPATYSDRLEQASQWPSVQKFIEAAANALRIQSLGSGSSYRKISFTGFTGPSTAVDGIFWKLPSDSMDTVTKIEFIPESNPVWRNWGVEVWGYSSGPVDNIFNANPISEVLGASVYYPTLSLNGMSVDSVRYMWAYLKGGKLNSIYGTQAEGFGLKGIKAYGKVYRKISDPVTIYPPKKDSTFETVTTTTTVNVEATVVYPTINNKVSVYNALKRKFQTNSLTTDAYITKIVYTDDTGIRTVNFSAGELMVGQTYTADGMSVSFASSPSSLQVTDSIINKSSSQGLTISSAPVLITFDYESFTLQTSASYYSGASIYSVTNDLGSNYSVRNIAGQIIGKGLNTVTVNDGVLLICNQNGTPYGLLTESQIRASVTNPKSETDEEIDLRYGYLSTINLLAEESGFIYGFYDLANKEFIGKTISYLEVIRRGFSNVYIGVCAIDADGNTQNKNEFIGPVVDMTFKPVNVPMKSVHPIFSVKYSNNTAIRVGRMSPNLSKFETWELPITNGSFVKRINVSETRAWTDWKHTYKGQGLTAIYSTADVESSVSSEVFGSGYYDVIDETPTLVSDDTIRVSRAPILAWNHPTTNLDSNVGIIRAEVDIYTRSTISSSWVKVRDSQIRDVNCHTGIIQFQSRLVPTNEELIKVSYVTTNKDKMIRQVNGIPVPLNPVLNAASIVYNKPLYIYLMPKAIFKESEMYLVAPTFTKVTEYNRAAQVNFTYDTTIFNDKHSAYDPFALPIAVVYVTNNPYNKVPELTDLRVKGGGFQEVEQISPIIDMYPSVTSNWDIYPPNGKAYPKGGYVIIQIPASVKNHFIDQDEIRQVISNNLTAGVVYDLQDLDGNSWS